MKLRTSRLLAPTLAIAVLASVRPTAARGLKALRAPEAGAALGEKLEAENEALKRSNKRLEAMMQVAQAEVHRVKVAIGSRKPQQQNTESPQVLSQEVSDLRKKLHAVQADKQSLVQTLRKMLAKNATQVFQKQADRTKQKFANLERRCGHEQQEMQSQNEEINGKFKEIKDASQSLQEQNVDLQRGLQDVRDKLAASEEQIKQLGSDKTNLVHTMHSLMRESTALKKDLQKEQAIEKTDVEELTHDKAVIAELKKKAAKPSANRTSSGKKPAPGRGREESAAAQMVHMNKLIGDTPLREVSEAESAAALAHTLGKSTGGKGLSDWLGIKAEAPPAKDKDRKAQAQNKTDDEGDGIDALLSQAKAQLAAMDRDDDEGDEPAPSP